MCNSSNLHTVCMLVEFEALIVWDKRTEWVLVAHRVCERGEEVLYYL